MPEERIIAAAIESIAENTNDGIIAPMFYLILGGPVLAVVYKAINTLDSMIGNRNEEYIHFGWFAARLDDIVNFIPARISGFLISLSSFILGRGFIGPFKTMIRDGARHSSPNSGISEAAMAGAKYKLDNLTAICDFNRVQLDGPVDEIMPLEPLTEKWKAFNWHVIEIDGHKMDEILVALDRANEIDNKPVIILAHTVKGKGVPFMEHRFQWHGKAPEKEEYEVALQALEGQE